MAAPRPKSKIAVVDDDPAIRSQVMSIFGAGHEVLEGASLADAYRLLQDGGLDVLLLDANLPATGHNDPFKLVENLAKTDIDTLVFVLFEEMVKAKVMRLIEAGAYEFFVKPVDPAVLRLLVERAVEKLQVQRENRILREAIRHKNEMGDLIGSTEAMRHVFDAIRRVAPSNTTVVVRGESGTGKELVARAIHENSPRRGGPFVSVNCAALPEGLMESELFGYEKGAFTGAVAAKEGRIEMAQRGTLFLDEIGTLPPTLQSKLLRVLEDHSLVRLGGKKSIRVDFRLVSATNENLEEAVRRGHFREDLYYRIHVLPLFVPPLRERVEDIPLLLDYFLRLYCTANRLATMKISHEAMRALKQYPWPGNVREMENLVQRLVLMAEHEEIGAGDLPSEVFAAGDASGRSPAPLPAAGFRLDEEVAAYERRLVETALAQAHGVKAQAARLLGVDDNRIKYLCRKHRLGGR
ncbi:MAG TPA: sigma-54 dependent transcriptional regulator [Candidatus Acidoferrales bacterium]|nr:sigma-54 dependent transcriptional regulator [Candidatus Acidoferrales bacterium]